MKNTFAGNKTAILILVLISIFCSKTFSLSVPQARGYVNDYAKILKASEESEISSYLEALYDSTGIQIAVLTIPSLNGEDLELFSLKVAEKWQIGKKDKDSGALLLVALKDRKMRIETGYGLEDKLTDAKCGLIIRNVLAPEFRNGDYGKGILKAVQNMGGIASDDESLISNSVKNPGTSEEENGSIPFFGALIIMFFWYLIFSSFAKRRGGAASKIFAAAVASSLYNSSRSYHGSSNHFSSSSHHSFSGGGGHFGGGGASGGW